MLRSLLLSLVLLLPSSSFAAPPFKAGTAKKVITPTEPLWMAGYASRTKACDTTHHDLWVKALALEDAKGHPFILLTSDLCGIPRSLSEVVATEVMKKTGLKRENLLLNMMIFSLFIYCSIFTM